MFDPSPAVASELSRHLLVGVRRSSRYYHQTVPHSRHHRSRLTGSRNGVILCCSKGEESARCRRREHHAVAARARQSEVRTTPKMFVCCFLVVLLRFSKPLCRSQRYINGFQSYANKSDRFAPAFFCSGGGEGIMASRSTSKHPGKSFFYPSKLHPRVESARAVQRVAFDRSADSHHNGSLAADLACSPRALGSARLASSSGAEREVMSSSQHNGVLLLWQTGVDAACAASNRVVNLLVVYVCVCDLSPLLPTSQPRIPHTGHREDS